MAHIRGPNVPPVEMADDQGTYLLYVGRYCRADNCGVQLTSRNRSGVQRLCQPHGRARDRARKRGKDQSRAGNTIDPNPRSSEAHSLLDHFLSAPLQVDRLDELHAFLVDVSLIHHFRYID
jgi:hypothetical protein